ncbi:MAG: ribbon-helix-helix protein, CopG family [Gemmataceae bacterium]
MSEVAIAVSETTRRQLQEMADRSGRPPAELLERAVAEYHARQFWAAVNAGYAALRADPAAWAEEEAERRLWDATLMDGLDRDESWTADRRPSS